MKNFIKKMIKNEKGITQVTETLILSGVAIAIAVVVFFPAAKSFMESASGDLTDWYSNQTEKLF